MERIQKIMGVPLLGRMGPPLPPTPKLWVCSFWGEWDSPARRRQLFRIQIFKTLGVSLLGRMGPSWVAEATFRKQIFKTLGVSLLGRMGPTWVAETSFRI